MQFATNPEDGTRIAYELVGEGAPLVLVHGSLSSRRAWQVYGYVDALRSDQQLILIDARGHGESEKPTTSDGYAMERLVGDVTAVLDACDTPRAAYLGYSLGGRVGFGLAIHAPNRIRALVAGGASHRPQRGALDRLFYPGCIDTIETEGIEAFLGRWSERLGRAIGPAVAQTVLDNDPSMLVPFLRQIDREPGFDERVVARIRLPVLLFAGERDHERLADARAAAALIPGAELFVVADGDHESTPASVDDVVRRVRAFLNREG